MIRRLLLFIMWFVALPFLSLQAQSPGGVARTADGDSTTACSQSMRVVTFKAVPGTARTYYYHRDHLGSSTLITNESGEVVQRVEYLPTGETFIEQQDTSWVSPYKFNGKELDEETGLYYYGARYYDPRLSIWLGTDPMQGKYPGISTYAYCMGNPVKFVDPDGRKLKLTSFDTYTDLSVIASTLPMEYRKYVSLNGLYVDKDLLNFGYQLHGDKVGENYKSLLEIVESDKTVEFALSDNKNAVSGTGILLTNTNIHLPFKDPVIDCYADNEPEPNGSVGFSLAPRSHTWTSNDLFQRNQLNLGEQLFSTNDNYQVLLNKRLMRYKSLIPILRKAVAHELYSHILFMLRGKDSLHRPERRGINSNSEFEQWSRDRISETINNE